jgi:hypothetical protein
MTAERHNNQIVMCVKIFVYVTVEREASSQAGRALRHSRARCVKDTKWQHISLAEQVRYRASHELLGNLLISQGGSVACSTL